MFAILISEENLPKIMERTDKTPHVEESRLKMYMRLSRPHYYVTGYHDRRSVLQGNSVLPQHVLDAAYEYDPVKIKTDWDQIVRK